MQPIRLVILILSTVLLTSFTDQNRPDYVEQYISQYKDIAISEMHRTGIPASIKLAQGMLESNWGRSTLATQANNHFGIKCGSNWTGETFYREDDDYVDGKIVKSCFRKFGTVLDSYMAHSAFIANPNRERYALLFYFPSNDYKSWAYGLKDAGYATDPKYPSKLINIIEKYELYEYDNGDNQYYTTTQEDSTLPAYQFADSNGQTIVPSESTSDQPVVKEKDTQRTVMITEGRRVVKNHSPDFSSNPEKESSRSKTYRKSQRNTQQSIQDGYHIVADGESMKSIAQRYGLPSLMLYSRNRMPLGSQPEVGEKIQLKGIVRVGDRPEFYYPEKESKSEFVLTPYIN